MKADRLDLLLHALFEESLGEAERGELNEILLTDPAARARYRRAAAVHGALIRATAAKLPEFAAASPALPGARRRTWRLALGIAALMVITSILPTISYLEIRGRLPRAEILKVTRPVWPAGARELVQGELPAKSPIELCSGLIEIGYPSGARVVVEGPCRFSLNAKEALTVLHGRASVQAPEGAEGFLIDTPGGRFIDRGTEFGVAVGSDGNYPVVLTEVFKGEIDVMSTADTTHTRLTGGQSRVVARDGKLLDSLDEAPVRLANGLHRSFVSSGSPATNLALGKPVLSPGYCIRPHGSIFPPDNLTDGRLDDSGVPGDWSFWLAPDGESGEVTVDLIATESISRISLQNTNNRGMDDRGTESFEVYGSLDNKSYFPLTAGELPRVTESRGSEYPFHDFKFDRAEARYVKLVVTRHFRDEKRPSDHPCQGGGLNEIRIFAE